MDTADPRPDAPIPVNVGSPVLPGGEDLLTALLGALLEQTPGGVLVVNEDNEVVTMNAEFARVWGIETGPAYDESRGVFNDEVLLASAMEQVADPDAFISRVRELYADPTQRDRCEILLRDGRTLDRHSGALWSADGAYVGRVWFFEDITESKRREEALTELATTDDLTGVANRRRFASVAATAFARARAADTALSVAVLDVDNFKLVNDTFGHALGDELLRTWAADWSAVVRGDDLVARIGGDEFAVLMAGVGPELAERLGHRLVDAARRAGSIVAGVPVAATVSIGLATLAPGDRTVDDLMERADRSLYWAKEAGRDRVGPVTDDAAAPRG